MAIDRPGIYPDMSSDEYFNDPCPAPSLTQSIAKLLIARSPLHAKCAHPRLRDPVSPDDEPVETYVKAKAIGNAAHKLMIGRGKELAIAPWDSWRTGDARGFRDKAEAGGQVAILKPHFELAAKMVAAARDQLDAGGYPAAFSPDCGDGEVCVAWEEDGFWFRTLIDWLPADRKIPWDYKTSEQSVAPHGIGRMMADAGWDVQAAMHERGLYHIDPVDFARRFRFVAQEQQEPYPLVVCELTDDVMAIGRKKLDYAIRIWRHCMSTGQWPGYPLELQTPQYPAWAENAWLQREITEAAQERHGERDTRNLMAG